MSEPSKQTEKCMCRKLNNGMTYTGDCPIHQAIPEITLEGLKQSKHTEAKAVLNFITSEHQRLYRELVNGVVEYMDCKERTEMNWQNCICPLVKTVPLATIDKIFNKEEK